MRSIVGTLVVIVVLAGSSTAEEIYRWKDPLGGLHFENVPTPRRSVLRGDPDGSETGGAGASETGAADVLTGKRGEPADFATGKKKLSPDEVESYSTDVSTRRSRLQRELRVIESQLRDIDGRLATLQRARLKNAHGSAATGGVAAVAFDVLSPEEETLIEQRDELAQRAVEVRNEAAQLRQEVEARLGTVPAWWIDLR